MNFLENAEWIMTTYPGLAFAGVFLAGVVSSASPCVLATIPLVVGYVGGYAQGDRRAAFRYSLAFVLGLSLTFTAFGAAAGLVGTMFGNLGGKWYIAAGVVALLMGLQLLGCYELRLPFHWEYRPKRAGMVSAFLLGLFFGVVSSPCATPVLVVLLTLVATKGGVFYGIALLFTYAVGHCVLMLVAGTCVGFVESLAKARGVASFSTWTKRLGGLMVALVGVYLLWNA